MSSRFPFFGLVARGFSAAIEEIKTPTLAKTARIRLHPEFRSEPHADQTRRSPLNISVRVFSYLPVTLNQTENLDTRVRAAYGLRQAQSEIATSGSSRRPGVLPVVEMTMGGICFG
jgi:hypothetical protein